MPESRDAHVIVQSAEKAAAEGDYQSAERLLREAAALQEATLGPLHPDLANTLNNLGVLYEMTNQPAEAEDCYRRAFVIATAVLVPDHPFVATSGKNLRDFCEARGRPIDLPVSPPAPVREEERGGAPPPTASWEALEETPQPTRHESLIRKGAFPTQRSSRRPLVVGAIAAGALLVLLFAARAWFSPNANAGFSPDEAPAPVGSSPAPAPAPPAAREPAPAAPIVEPTPAPAATNPPPGRERPPGDASTLARPSVAEAQVCRNLSTRNWRCDPASASTEPGRFYFYTRLKSPTNTTVEHRWYQGSRLHQNVELRVRANPSGGYRTFSRNTVTRANAGEWRVELRAKDGTLLDEQRFTVH